MGEPVSASAGTARMGSNEGGEAFGEGALRAAAIGTEEATHVQADGDAQAIDGNICGVAPMVGV